MMNKRFKAACLTTFAVSMIAVPVQAGILDLIYNSVDSIHNNSLVSTSIKAANGITKNPLVSTCGGIVSTIQTGNALMHYGRKCFSNTNNTAKSKNGKVIGIASAAALLTAMSGCTSESNAGNLTLAGLSGVLYSCYCWYSKCKVDAIIARDTGKKQDIMRNGSYSFVDGLDDVNIAQIMPEKDKINVWLEGKAMSFEAIKDTSNDLVNILIEAATPGDGDNGVPAEIDLGNFSIDPKDDTKTKTVKVFKAVRQEYIDIEKSLKDLGGLLKGSGFVTALNKRFGELMGKLKITGMHELSKEYEDVFCDSARKFQRKFDGVLPSLIPQFKEASREYVEVAIKINRLKAMLIRLWIVLTTPQKEV